MNTFSKKYYNKETKSWEPLYSTEGLSAYKTAQLNGFTGTEEEFNEALSQIPIIIKSIEDYPTKNSENLITSGGVYKAINETKLKQSNLEEPTTTISGGELFRYIGTSSLTSSIALTNFSEKYSTAMLIIPANLSVSFTSSSTTIKQSEDITGTSDQIKAYTIQYVIGDLLLINSTIYS